ncbi:RpL13 [Ecytonucleospora hepatopenaei]|uniref:RpL13 n=1 Tax=Ecytonucleospora hepatopenaei TaxID=646526 RepID=A0A1W0E6Z5_9MICR|nr:RpL13 [Ecytonucleospora hepatopenaei]
MKRNNQLPNNHFKKTAKRIKTWFDQPANKLRRRKNREEKAKKMAPLPTDKLRPVVRCQSIRYNKKERLGRGFTPEECKAAGMDYQYAKTIGVAVDFRRRNMNQEAFDQNVQRLKEYQSKVTVYKNYKEARAAGAKQYRGTIMPLTKKNPEVQLVSAAEIKNY